MTQKHLTFKQRTANLEIVKFALARGYTPWTGNIDARKHFSFYHLKDGAPNIHISWFDVDEPNIKVGHTGTRGDERALRLLEEYWIAVNPKTITEQVQEYLERDLPRSVLIDAYRTGKHEPIVRHIKGHYDAGWIGELIGIETVVRDALQNIALKKALPAFCACGHNAHHGRCWEFSCDCTAYVPKPESAA